MYTLYFLPGACSLATQVVLNELAQPVRLIHKQDAENFQELNPAGTVPVLKHDGQVLNEGVAILLQLLQQHDNPLLPSGSTEKQRAIEDMMFANASMHPAYGRLFFLENNLNATAHKQQAFQAAASAINHLWSVVETKLGKQAFLGGDTLSPADIMLTVYSRWGGLFPVDIVIGPRTRAMINRVIQRDSFQLALQREANYATSAA
ncbi:glutathione S-transferase family protein [Pseudomaricurvus sp. HS19]|uniref:glutathione S-transferase family protein n=1 Tax=Pseudomaricurvus sp. HS19 TaxID=2692626 RepID=UPI00136F5444|nr:glutathione S-transferase family protein [Pseudomaricurvus sp. HS19]MYM63373.1 glutathione S-transferase [Pseudomaricurvus sp. HS19]